MMNDQPHPTKLTNKQRRFIEEYLRCFNATQAAIKAGYSQRTAGSIGSENLTKPEIKAEVDRHLAELKMSADEVLTRLTEQGRASVGDFLLDDGSPNWTYIKDHGHLLKSIAQTRHGWRIELYDGQNALIQMGKTHGLFTDRHEISGELALKLYENVSPDDWDNHAGDSLQS